MLHTLRLLKGSLEMLIISYFSAETSSANEDSGVIDNTQQTDDSQPSLKDQILAEANDGRAIMRKHRRYAREVKDIAKANNISRDEVYKKVFELKASGEDIKMSPTAER